MPGRETHSDCSWGLQGLKNFCLFNVALERDRVSVQALAPCEEKITGYPDKGLVRSGREMHGARSSAGCGLWACLRVDRLIYPPV